MGISCCYGCEKPKRHVGCHSTCPEYLEQHKANEELKKKIRNEQWNYSMNTNGTMWTASTKHKHWKRSDHGSER